MNERIPTELNLNTCEPPTESEVQQAREVLENLLNNRPTEGSSQEEKTAWNQKFDECHSILKRHEDSLRTH